MGVTAKYLLDIAKGYIGYSEQNRKYIEILNIYNNHKPLALGYKVKADDEWCDTFVSAVAIKAGAVDLIGTECGCERHIQIFKKNGIWIEDGRITPKPGDIILYNWDRMIQPNDGFADHIGYVENVADDFISVIEGNMRGVVGRRRIKVGSGCIRGYARPKYSTGQNTYRKTVDELAMEVLNGKWGNGYERKEMLKKAGYDYSVVQKKINELLAPVKKDDDTIAREVINGVWGVGNDRKVRLEKAGYDYNIIQKRVDEILKMVRKR